MRCTVWEEVKSKHKSKPVHDPAAAIHECCDVRRNRALETVTGSRTGSCNQSGGVRSSGSFLFYLIIKEKTTTAADLNKKKKKKMKMKADKKYIT